MEEPHLSGIARELSLARAERRFPDSPPPPSVSQFVRCVNLPGSVQKLSSHLQASFPPYFRPLAFLDRKFRQWPRLPDAVLVAAADLSGGCWRRRRKRCRWPERWP